MGEPDAEEVPEEEDLFIDDEDEEEEIDIVNDGSHLDSASRRFDQLVGALADAIMDDEFEGLKDTFCQSNCQHFEDNDENKLIYTQLHEQYVELLEKGLLRKLEQSVPGFSFDEFSEMITTYQEHVPGDLLDLLMSIGDFETFKDMMLSYKQESLAAMGLSCHAMKIHAEEMEEGDERPDLDMGLTVSAMRL